MQEWGPVALACGLPVEAANQLSNHWRTYLHPIYDVPLQGMQP